LMSSFCYLVPFFYLWPKTFDVIQTLIKIAFKAWLLGYFLFVIYSYCSYLLYIFNWSFFLYHLSDQLFISTTWTVFIVWICYICEYHPTLWLVSWNDYFLSGKSTTASKELIVTKESIVIVQKIKKSVAYRGITKFLFFLLFSFILGFFLLCIIVIIMISW